MTYGKGKCALTVAYAGLAVLSAGCFGHLSSADASFRGFDVPVMLGPKDRVGGDGKPLATTKVDELDATAKHAMGNETRDDVSVQWELEQSDLAAQARRVTKKQPPDQVDIRLTEVKPQSVGVLVAMKARVDVRGDVVRVGGAK